LKTKGARLTYSKTGIDRRLREKSQLGIQEILDQQAKKYQFGTPLNLPFCKLFPASSPGNFYDFQIEGVGTKTLLAELVEKYDTIGADGVAMAVNDVLRSGAEPLLISDGIHIAKSDDRILRAIIGGVRAGARDAGAILASGETGDVRELLHPAISESSLPFDLLVACLGMVASRRIITGQISRGDQIIGLESSGIHSNGLTLARRVLLKKWGGFFEPEDRPDELGKSVADELLKPTRIYARALRKLAAAGLKPKAALHVTGDGLAKFRRLLNWQRERSSLGISLHLQSKPPIFELIMKTAKEIGSPISAPEMFRTFNMGIGFALIFPEREIDKALDSLNNEVGAEKIGFVSDTRKISIESPFTEKPVIL
jgi:phosphoribosylformylglycinamidine cyclo-ligase